MGDIKQGLIEPTGQYNEIIVAFITSQIPFQLLPTDLLIDKDMDGFMELNLPHRSTIRLHKLATINAELATGSFGKLPKTLEKEVGKKLSAMFNLN